MNSVINSVGAFVVVIVVSLMGDAEAGGYTMTTGDEVTAALGVLLAGLIGVVEDKLRDRR